MRIFKDIKFKININLLTEYCTSSFKKITYNILAVNPQHTTSTTQYIESLLESLITYSIIYSKY